MKPFRSLLLPTLLATACCTLGVGTRLLAEGETAESPASSAKPVVNVVRATRAAATFDLTLPANLQALQETALYARTGGYVQRYLVDIGDQVKAGQTLAVLEAPETIHELEQAKATLEQARANRALAQVNAKRWKTLGEQKAVATTDVDDKETTLSARDADVHAAEANVARLTQLVQYLTITAPFDGVISARNLEVGDLVSSGSSGKALFRIAQVGTLRVYVSVPQSNFDAVRPGTTVDVLVNERPRKVYPGKVVRVAGSLDATTHTRLVEAQIPNEEGELLSGMFAQVRLHLTPPTPPLLVPSNALVVRAAGTFVATVDATAHLHLVPVKIGRDFGLQVEILSGLQEGADVSSNPRDFFTDGLEVTVQRPEPKKG